MTASARLERPMLDALDAAGPYPAYADKLMLFGRLVGSWHCDGRFLHPDGGVRESHRGEWHFGWALEGRAIQDVLISPPREELQAGEEFFEYGTTVRIYDPRRDAWNVVFTSATTGAIVNLEAREVGEEIWLEGRGPEDRLDRWTFSEISPTFVRWQGFVSRDEGQTWARDEEILLSRSQAVR